MEKIKIKSTGQMYDIVGIRSVGAHLLQIDFAGSVPDAYGDLELYTDGGILATTLPGWETVYRTDGKTVYLSDDGSVYTPSEEPGPVTPTEPYVPSLDELKAAKKREIGVACEAAIYAGVDVKLSDGSTEHFSLMEHDQLNLFGKQVQLASEATELEYHADGQPCRYYTAKDMQTIISTAMAYVSYHTTYCNALNMWINGVADKEELGKIVYGVTVPDEYQSDVLKDYLAGGDTDAKPVV